MASSDLDRRGVGQPLIRNGNNPTSAASEGDHKSEYTGSTSDTTTLPALPGLPRGPYVVVPETKDPHQTLATAQELPDIPYFRVVGTIGSGGPIDLYRLTLSSRAEGLDFGLGSDQSLPSIPMQLQLFDGTGHVLGEWSVGGQGTPSLYVELGGQPAGSTFYFGITAGNPSGPGGPSATIDYQLWISRESMSDRSTAVASTGTTVPTSAMMPAIASPLAFSAGLGILPSSGDPQAALASPPNERDGVRVAVGSPALRSARPSGGLLSDGDPAPPATPDFNAAVNKEWDESSLTGLTPRHGKELEPTALSGRENEPDALLVIQGPGGFPLLGAVAIGHRRRNPATAVGDFSTPRTKWDWDPEIAAGLAAQEFIANAEIPVRKEGDTVQSRTLPVRDWEGYPVPVFSGLGLATVFTLNAVLSQPIAGFDYLTSRLDANGRPLSDRKGRLRKPAAPPHSSSPFDDPPR